MLSWLNPRVIVSALTILVLVDVSKSQPPELMARRAIFVCASLFLLFVLAFVWPLCRAVGVGALLGMIAALAAAWAATGLALISDALPPPTPDPQIQPPWNWPRTAFVIAAAIAFYLFFNATLRGFRKREELRESGGIV